jgi:thiol-disulfide isomerase/thioredoxin
MSFRSTILPLLMLTALAGGCDRQDSSKEQANVAAVAPATAAQAAGHRDGEKVAVDSLGALDRSHKGEAAPTLAFEGPDGKPMTLAAFAGHPVLVNLWATWCGPCVAEMPTLDAAAATFPIATISQDKDRPTVDAYFKAKGFKNLKPYLDSKLGFSVGFNASLPTSILYDASGHEVWRMAGGMDWTTPTAKALLAEAK